RRAGNGLLDRREVRGRDRLVDEQGDVELVDRAGRDLRVVDALVERPVGAVALALVLGVRAAGGAARRVGRDVGAGARRAARGDATALELLGLLLRLQRHALLG